MPAIAANRYEYGGDVPKEKLTGAAVGITSDHNNIHTKLGFSVSNAAEGVADDGYLYIELRPAAGKYGHLKICKPWTEGGLASFEIVEAPTLTAGLTALTPQNRNRVAPVPASGIVCKSNPTAIANGTVIHGPVFFGGGGAGGGAGDSDPMDAEIVMAPETIYLARVRNLAGAAKALSLWLFWYEETAGAY